MAITNLRNTFATLAAYADAIQKGIQTCIQKGSPEERDAMEQCTVTVTGIQGPTYCENNREIDGFCLMSDDRISVTLKGIQAMLDTQARLVQYLRFLERNADQAAAPKA
jgi:hypothetical protein